MKDLQLKAFKQELISDARHKLRQGCMKYKGQIASLRGSLESESKSSAGDKHETGRAMVQLEIERLSARWKKAEEELSTFEQVVAQEHGSGIVAPGCLVKTDKGLYFLSVSLGLLQVDQTPVAVVSSVSPIGQVLKGKAIGDEFQFNAQTHTIQFIC